MVDPATGLKIFDTRAAPATEKITGSGYGVTDDASLKVLPEQPAGAVSTPWSRRSIGVQRGASGAADYMPMEGDFAKYLQDVYSTAGPDTALADECDIVVVGAGFAGCCSAEAQRGGLRRRPILREGWRRRGTWYWNLYPASPATSTTATYPCSRRWVTSRR